MPNELETRLWDLLKQHPAGLSEYELLRLLQSDLQHDFGPDLFRDELAMYRAHFLLFHALYRLSDFLKEKHQAGIEIHVLKIIILPLATGNNSLPANPDPLREHYLNLENLEDTSLEDIKALLGQFWTRYFAAEKRPQALTLLDLDESASNADIEQRYRVLAMRYHPDRGGDAQQFQKLQQAISVLRRGA